MNVIIKFITEGKVFDVIVLHGVKSITVGTDLLGLRCIKLLIQTEEAYKATRFSCNSDAVLEINTAPSLLDLEQATKESKEFGNKITINSMK